MAIYLYKCSDPAHDEFEVEHSINSKLEFCPKCQEEGKKHPEKVIRLISGGTSFALIGGCWASDNYR